MNGLDLFSGIGGISLGLKDYMRPVAYCEIDSYCQGILLSRMADKMLATAPIWDDITTFPINEIYNKGIDIIYGGFPCQDISIAGNGKGLAGEQSGLFFEIVRLAKEIKPRFIFLENVPAITTRGGIQVVGSIAEMGYDCRWCCISAASVGALHKRERWFLLANAYEGSSGRELRGLSKKDDIIRKSEKCRESKTTESCDGRNDVAHSGSESTNGYAERKEKTYSMPRISGQDVCDTLRQPSEQANQGTESEQTEEGTRRGLTRQYWPFESREHWQETVSRVCRTSDGVQFQVDRLRALGNSVVPQQVKKAFEILMGIKHAH